MTSEFYNQLKEDIISQSDKIPPLFLAVGSIGIWRLNRDKQKFGSTSSKEQIWDYMQFLNNKIEKDQISQDKLDQIFQCILTERFLKAEMLGKKRNQNKEAQNHLKDDLVNPNGAFTILSLPSSDDENDDDDDDAGKDNEDKKNKKTISQPNQQKKSLVSQTILKNDKEQEILAPEQLSEGQIQKQINWMKQHQQQQQQSRQYIQQMLRKQQKQKYQRIQQLLEEQKAEAICKICYMEIEQTDMYPLDSCEHMYHEQCLKNHFEFSIKQGNFPIKCPETECGKDIAIGDIRQIVDQEMQNKYYQFSFKKYVVEHPNQVSCCPTADCQFHFYWVQKKDGEEFNCPQCKKKYCLSCRADWHEGMSCQEYKESQNPDENQKKFDTFVTGQNFKKCPHCGYWVERTFGCEYIVCKCGKNFCYLCGKGHKEHFCPDRNKYQNAYAAPVLFGGANRRPAARRAKPKAVRRKAPAKRAATPAKRATRATAVKAKPTPRKKK